MAIYQTQRAEIENQMENRKYKSILSIFMHADGIDIFLMIIGLIGSIGDGLSGPVMMFITSKLANNLGNATIPSHQITDLAYKINKVPLLSISLSTHTHTQVWTI